MRLQDPKVAAPIGLSEMPLAATASRTLSRCTANCTGCSLQLWWGLQGQAPGHNYAPCVRCSVFTLILLMLCKKIRALLRGHRLDSKYELKFGGAGPIAQ